MKTIDMELAVAGHLDPIRNLIIPNVSWGMFNHELDLLVLTKSGYVWEIEIKVSKADLIRDKEKRHGHYDPWNRIRCLYFAIPEKLLLYKEHIPKRAGIIVVDNKSVCCIWRKPIPDAQARKFTIKEQFKIARLGAIRVWGLKRKLAKKKERNINENK